MPSGQQIYEMLLGEIAQAQALYEVGRSTPNSEWISWYQLPKDFRAKVISIRETFGDLGLGDYTIETLARALFSHAPYYPEAWGDCVRPGYMAMAAHMLREDCKKEVVPEPPPVSRWDLLE